MAHKVVKSLSFRNNYVTLVSKEYETNEPFTKEHFSCILPELFNKLFSGQWQPKPSVNNYKWAYLINLICHEVNYDEIGLLNIYSIAEMDYNNPIWQHYYSIFETAYYSGKVQKKQYHLKTVSNGKMYYFKFQSKLQTLKSDDINDAQKLTFYQMRYLQLTSCQKYEAIPL